MFLSTLDGFNILKIDFIGKTVRLFNTHHGAFWISEFYEFIPGVLHTFDWKCMVTISGNLASLHDSNQSLTFVKREEQMIEASLFQGGSLSYTSNGWILEENEEEGDDELNNLFEPEDDLYSN